MPKRRVPIVPTATAGAPGASGAFAAKKAKKAAKKALAHELDEIDDNDSHHLDASQSDAATNKDGEIIKPATNSLLMVDDAAGGWPAFEKPGLEIIAEPDKADKAARFLRWLLHPMEPHEFLNERFGRTPIVISRAHHGRGYYKGVFSLAELRRQLSECALRWTDDVDAARYEDGVRTTHNGNGIATEEAALQKYAAGCSLRLSWPQRHSDALWGVLTQLEEYFGSAAGVNAYATPAGAQGFAPHFDDIDAFILQLEGEKRWKCYAPRNAAEALPRFSSPNLQEDELGDLLGDFVLKPGDLLYLPRGIVHQAATHKKGGASLHVTASVGRCHAWRDLLEVGVLGALETAAARFPEWRENLPVDLSDHLGIRAAISNRLREMLHTMCDELPLDAMVDQFVCKGFLFDRMPPRLSNADTAKLVQSPGELTLESRVRLITRRACRLAVEEGVAALYTSSQNGRAFRAHGEPQHIDFALEAAPSIEAVLKSYPKYVAVRSLPADSDAQRLDIARALAEAGLLLLKPAKA